MVHHLDNQANRRVPKQISAPLPPKRIRPPTARASRNLPGSLRESVRWVARRRSPPRVRRLEPGIRCRILLFGCVCIGRKPGSGPSRHTPPASRSETSYGDAAITTPSKQTKRNHASYGLKDAAATHHTNVLIGCAARMIADSLPTS
eukprot:3836002-Pyramimonas_sp.AAC.1